MTHGPNSTWHHFKRRTAIVARWLHIYLSMISFAVLLFFAITGLTLNHADRFSGAPRTTHAQGTIDLSWTKGSVSEPDGKQRIVEELRAAQHIRSELSEFRVDDQQVELAFKGPAYVADVLIERPSGKYTLTETRQGAIAVMNDLHKGRDSGTAWAWIIDVSAVLMTLVSFSGLVLIFFLHKRRASGLLAIAIGALACYLVYVIWVP